MANRFMVTAAAVALIAGTGFAYAQGTGTSKEPGASMQQGSPSTGGGSAQKHESTQGMKSSQSEQKSPTAGKNERAEEKGMGGPKSKSMSSENEAKGGKKQMKAEGREDRNGMKAEGREGRDKMKAEGREDRNRMKAEGREGRENRNAAESRDNRNAAEGREDRGKMNAQGREGQNTNMNAERKGAAESQTTVGQAGAGAKLSTDQRTRITSVFREQHVASVPNVNFELRPGVRVSRDVRFYPLPPEIVTIYPEWRGYEFIRVGDKIVVINPRTLEIVDVIEA